MKIWIDADACPNVIKEILFRMAERTQTSLTLVANQWIKKPPSDFIHFIQVADGPDIADDEIVNLCGAGDLIITADIPLAARVVDKGAFALDPRGTFYDASNVRQALSMRDFMDSLRGSGVDTGGPDSFHHRDRQAFANALDRFIMQKG